MADDESTDVLNDSALEADDAIDLEDIEVSEEELDQAGSQDDADEELAGDDTEEESVEPEEPEVEAEDETDDEIADNTNSEDDTPDEAKPEVANEEQEAAHRQEMYEKRQAEKAAREAQIKESQQAYLDEAEDSQDLALRQLQIDAYENRVERFNNKLTGDYNRAIQDFKVLQDANPVVQKRLDKALDAFQAQHVTVDQFGNPTDLRGDLYQYLQDEAADIEQLTGIGAQKQTKSKVKEKARTISPPARAPREPKVDPDIAAFDEEAGF